MNHALSVTNAFAASWTDALLRACWQGGLGIALVWLVCRLWPGMPPAPRCWLWRLAYAKLLLGLVWLTPLALPLLPKSPSPQPLAPAAVRVATAAPAAFADEPPTASVPAPALPLAAPPAPPAPAHLPMPPPRPTLPTVQTWLLAAWLLGVLVSLGRVAAAWRRARVLYQTSTPLADAALEADAAALCRRFGLRHAPPLRVADSLLSPLLLGWGRPAILLPAFVLTNTPRSEVRLMLAHELAHLARWDLLWNALPLLAQRLFFFHPLVWLAGLEWSLAQEIACDARAVEVTGTPPAAYGRMLLGIATRRHDSAAPLFPTLAVAAPRHTLRRRLFAMQHIGTASHPRALLAAALVAALAIGGLLPWRVVAQSSRENTKATQPSHPALAPVQISPVMAEALDKEIAYREKHLRTVEQQQTSYLAAHPGRLSDDQQADLDQLQYLKIQRNGITEGATWGEVVKAKLRAHLAEARDVRLRKGFQAQIAAIDASRRAGEAQLPDLEVRLSQQEKKTALIPQDQRQATVKKAQFNTSVTVEGTIIAFLKARRAGEAWAQASITSPEFNPGGLEGQRLNNMRRFERKAQWNKDFAEKYAWLLATDEWLRLIAPKQDQWFRQMKRRNAPVHPSVAPTLTPLIYYFAPHGTFRVRIFSQDATGRHLILDKPSHGKTLIIPGVPMKEGSKLNFLVYDNGKQVKNWWFYSKDAPLTAIAGRDTLGL